jgi:hypothetical protein
MYPADLNSISIRDPKNPPSDSYNLGPLPMNTSGLGPMRSVPTINLFAPHMILIAFEGVANPASPMTFELTTSRIIEGRPTLAAQTLEARTCKLETAGNALELLRNHNPNEDVIRLKGMCMQGGMTEDQAN